ncbi:MAG: hypothetical protein UW16_C0005G0002 [Microgenomates group bacterium GW2011_GWC1_44_10]|uniref:Lipoprotein n=1 Tax=Candidatus Woesebacteria bacterium GW2011_GWA2_44_33 TaxID=1618564 RepID=A0A0G1J7U3_9BACT|nr:MAG: hypothetical protein UW16_C0005G0002 [Microgenomates group bacterium GW2011_GWC1_44_10]KKT67438.1 MAG: hypothetical protein UW60_C0006G0002 [Candidatus Woesebacteria bacterium GW2011_GWA2_44_33]
MYKRTKFLFLVILSLLLSACGPDEIQVPVERSTHYVEGPFSYVGNIESEHVDLFSYLRDDGKFCLISAATHAGMSISVSCAGEPSQVVNEDGIRYIGNVYGGLVNVYEYTKDGIVCTVIGGHGGGTLTSVDC